MFLFELLWLFTQKGTFIKQKALQWPEDVMRRNNFQVATAESI